MSGVTVAGFPVMAQTSVLVVGGGTAGVPAAMAAAEAGAKTLLIEEQGFLGGAQSGALVTPMMPNYLPDGGGQLSGGLNARLVARMWASGDGGGEALRNNGWFNPEALKGVLEEALLETGADLLFYVKASDVVMDGGRIVAVIVESAMGRAAITADVVIDASGDADVAYLAGAWCRRGMAETLIHRTEQPENQPTMPASRSQLMSLRFMMGGVDRERLAAFLSEKATAWAAQQGLTPRPPLIPEVLEGAHTFDRSWPLGDLFAQVVADGALEREEIAYLQWFGVPGRPGELAFNCPRIEMPLDPLNPYHLTRVQVEGKRRIRRLVAVFKRYIPGCENAYLGHIAPLVGVRESRRVVGQYWLTGAEYVGATHFEDGVARSNYPVDVHGAHDWTGATRPPAGQWGEIPFRSLVARDVPNLFMAGRCLSSDFIAQSALRIQPVCRAMGEAAGLGAAWTAAGRTFDGVAVRAALEAVGSLTIG
jgi:hypothetical protein